MERLDPEGNNPIAQATLFEQAVGSTAVPQAYLCCALQREQVRVYCLHLPSHYIEAMDGQANPWDDKEYAFLGDVTQGVITTVKFPNDAFQVVGNVRAKTSDYIVTNLNLLGNKGLPHLVADDHEVTLVATRRLIYLPYRHVPFFMSPAGYTLRETWEQLYPVLVANNDLQNCAPLINWLRVI
jgi:hypothetical protein